MSSAATRGVGTRIIHINVRNTAAVAYYLGQQPRAAPCTPAIGTENRSSFVLVALQTHIQRALRSRSIVRVGQVTNACFCTGLSVVNAIVIPNAGTFFCEAKIHVAGQASGLVEQTDGRTFLAGVREVLSYLRERLDIEALSKIMMPACLSHAVSYTSCNKLHTLTEINCQILCGAAQSTRSFMCNKSTSFS